MSRIQISSEAFGSEVEKYDRSRDFHTYSFQVAGTQVFILNPQASSSLFLSLSLSLAGQCLSYITLFLPWRRGFRLLTRHYPSIKTQAARVPVLSGQPERKQRRYACIYVLYVCIPGRERDHEQTTLLAEFLLDVKSHYIGPYPVSRGT